MRFKSKLIAFISFLLAFTATPCFAFQDGDPQKNVICIMAGVTVAKNGTSTYVIDLNSSQFGFRPTGEMSLQFKGFTHDVLDGATVSATWTGANVLPTGVTSVGILPSYQSAKSKMAGTTIVSGLNVVSGNSEYVYGFFTIDATRYILVNVTSGVSNLGVTAYVKVD